MEFWEILLIAIGLSMDSFAVSLAVGSAGKATGIQSMLRLSFHFGFFQFFMTVLGWSLGIWIEPVIALYDHWVAFVLLLFVAIRMIRDNDDKKVSSMHSNPTRGLMLLMLSTATSIDTLAIGLGLAMLRIKVLTPSLFIGLVTLLVSVIRVAMGSRLGRAFGRRMQIVGSVILIGMRIVISHMV
ncbi:MAG: manganese efflux pump [Chloroflexota bacterium]